jgi:glycosyltransferase involved in cell wall biosynthesis
MANNYFISIIAPIYNEDRFITPCINSILQQDFPKEKMEVLLIDGRSNDNTRNIIEQYTEKYSFIRLLDNPYER